MFAQLLSFFWVDRRVLRLRGWYPLTLPIYNIFQERGIHKLRWQARGRGSPKCQRYYISLYSKFVNEGPQKYSKFCQRSLWMPPNRFYICISINLFMVNKDWRLIKAFLQNLVLDVCSMSGFDAWFSNLLDARKIDVRLFTYFTARYVPSNSPPPHRLKQRSTPVSRCLLAKFSISVIQNLAGEYSSIETQECLIF